VQVDLKGPAGRLEALYEAPADARFAAVVCHPHPLHGGTMHTHAAYRIAKAVRAEGGASLRFNFRGVGRSAGTHDAGRGEVDDARAALAWLGARHPDLPRYACGFSFGAWMALEAGCADAAVRGVLCAGLALSLREIATVAVQRCEKPVAVVQAERDTLGPPDEVSAALAGAAGPRRLAVVKGATHLFTEDLAGLEREAAVALAWLRGGGA
jgi:alpha/beta superfamily hydrolase